MPSNNHWEDGSAHLPSGVGDTTHRRAGLAPVGGASAADRVLAPSLSSGVAVPSVAPKNWVEWEKWGKGQAGEPAPVKPVQGALSIVPPVGVDGDTGEVSTPRRMARRVSEKAKENGVFKNTAPEPRCAPLSITGAQTSKCDETAAFLDYMGVTFPGPDALQCAMDTFGPGLDWVPLDRGGYKYAKSIRRGEVSIYFGGEYNHNGEMRPHDTAFVVAAGKGCRQLEAEGVISACGSLDPDISPWRVFFKMLLGYGCKFPRLDVAIDDREGLLSLDVIEASLNAGDCSTRAKTFRRWPERSTSDGSLLGDAITVGNRSSMMFVRIYNKHLEQIVKGEIPPPVEDAAPVHWLRCELESHNEKATKLAQAIVQYGMAAVSAALWSVIDFKDPDDQEKDKGNKWRRKTVSWWQTFIDAAAKLRLTLDPKIRTVDNVVKWLNSAVAPSLALIECLPEAEKIFSALLQSGGERLRASHIAMLRANAERGGFIDTSCFNPQLQ